MTETIEDRIDRLFRELLDTHIELLAILLAESAVPVDEQRHRLGGLIRCLLARQIEPTIFDGGRRVAVALDTAGEAPIIKLNSELLSRVSDDEVFLAMASPIGRFLQLSPLSVSILLQTRDEEQLKKLATKASRRIDSPMVKPTAVPEYLDVKLNLFSERITSLARALGNGGTYELVSDPVLRERVSTSPTWPEWLDVADIESAEAVALAFGDALVGSPFAENASVLVELIWDSVGVSIHSFMRNAGRRLRGENFPKTVAVLNAIANVLAQRNRSFSPNLASWPVYSEIHDAWLALQKAEKGVFGAGDVQPRENGVSVLVPAKATFGINEPKTLPWAEPLVCWTVREQNALRDLFNGIIKTYTPGSNAHPNPHKLHRVDEGILHVDGDRGQANVEVVAVGAEVVPVDTTLMSRAWSAVLHRMLAQFDQLPENHQKEAIRQLRRAYDDYFPNAKSVWARRFYLVDHMGNFDAFFKLTTEIAHLLGEPALFDVFTKPNMAELAPFPTLVVVVANPPGTADRAPFWIPHSALKATVGVAPLRLRVVDAPPDIAEGCVWRCDRTLQLSSLDGQPLELMVRSMHNDCVQFAITT